MMGKLPFPQPNGSLGSFPRSYNMHLTSSLVLLGFSLQLLHLSNASVAQTVPQLPSASPRRGGTVRTQPAHPDAERSQMPSCRHPCISLWSHGQEWVASLWMSKVGR